MANVTFKKEQNTGTVMKISQVNGSEVIKRATVADINAMSAKDKLKYATAIKAQSATSKKVASAISK